MNFSQNPKPLQTSAMLQSQPQQTAGTAKGASAVNSCTCTIPSPQMMPQQQVFSMPQTQMTGPPGWVSELIEDAKHIKIFITKLDQIERTVNMINMKVSDLEMKVHSIEPKVTEVKQACLFISNENDNHKKEVQRARADVQKLKTDCTNMQNDANYLRSKNATLEAKVTDLESRSMWDNLLFYGISERGQLENCESLVKDVCIENLGLPEARNITFDRLSSHNLAIERGRYENLNRN